MLNHNYIGTEHILLGLIHEGEGVAAKALESLGISLEAVRQQVEEIIGQGQQAPSGHIPFTPRAKKVLELSLRSEQYRARPISTKRSPVSGTGSAGSPRQARSTPAQSRSGCKISYRMRCSSSLATGNPAGLTRPHMPSRPQRAPGRWTA